MAIRDFNKSIVLTVVVGNKISSFFSCSGLAAGGGVDATSSPVISCSSPNKFGSSSSPSDNSSSLPISRRLSATILSRSDCGITSFLRGCGFGFDPPPEVIAASSASRSLSFSSPSAPPDGSKSSGISKRPN